MKFEFEKGDRVRSVALPPAVHSLDHRVGTSGTVVKVANGTYESYYRVAFDDGRTWSVNPDDIEPEGPPCTIEEALAGIDEILEEEA